MEDKNIMPITQDPGNFDPPLPRLDPASTILKFVNDCFAQTIDHFSIKNRVDDVSITIRLFRDRVNVSFQKDNEVIEHSLDFDHLPINKKNEIEPRKRTLFSELFFKFSHDLQKRTAIVTSHKKQDTHEHTI